MTRGSYLYSHQPALAVSGCSVLYVRNATRSLSKWWRGERAAGPFAVDVHWCRHFVYIWGTTTEKGGLQFRDSQNNQNTIIFNDPDGFVATVRTQPGDPEPNIAAIGGAWIGPNYSFGGEQFSTIIQGNVEIGSGLQSLSDNELSMILTHELGHTLDSGTLTEPLTRSARPMDTPAVRHSPLPTIPQPLCTNIGDNELNGQWFYSRRSRHTTSRQPTNRLRQRRLRIAVESQHNRRM